MGGRMVACLALASLLAGCMSGVPKPAGTDPLTSSVPSSTDAPPPERPGNSSQFDVVPQNVSLSLDSPNGLYVFESTFNLSGPATVTWRLDFTCGDYRHEKWPQGAVRLEWTPSQPAEPEPYWAFGFGAVVPPDVIVRSGPVDFSLMGTYQGQFGPDQISAYATFNQSLQQPGEYRQLQWFSCQNGGVSKATFSASGEIQSAAIAFLPMAGAALRTMESEYYHMTPAGTHANASSATFDSPAAREVFATGFWHANLPEQMLAPPIYESKIGDRVVRSGTFENHANFFDRIDTGSFSVTIPQISYVGGWLDVYTFVWESETMLRTSFAPG